MRPIREGGSPQEQHRGVGRDQDGQLPVVHSVGRGLPLGQAQPDGAEPDDQGGADAVEQGVSDPSENERREGHERSRGNVSHAVGDQAASAARDANPKLDGHG